MSVDIGVEQAERQLEESGEAGECRLQDYWLEHQRTEKRMRDEPITKPKAGVFGPTVG